MTSVELSTLLHFGGGYNGSLAGEDGNSLPLRFCPSPGALYPVAIFVEARNVAGIDHGCYFYNPEHHDLRRMYQDNPLQVAEAVAVTGDDNCAARVWLGCQFERLKFKYGERSYRFALLEAGHIAQNLLLVAVGLGMGARPFGGFFDNAVRDGLGLSEFIIDPIYAVAVGHPEV